MKQLAQGHTAKEIWNQDLSLIPEVILWSLEQSEAAQVQGCLFPPPSTCPNLHKQIRLGGGLLNGFGG